MLNPMRFYLLFLSHWLLRTKINFDIHLPYIDIQSTHWYIYTHTTINTHKYNILTKLFDAWHTTYKKILRMSARVRVHNKLQRMSERDLRKLTYIQALNLQYFLGVVFKSTSCHADSSIYWHSFYEDILSACNRPVVVLSRRLPT